MLAMVAGKGSDGAVITANDYDIEAAKLIAQEAGAPVSPLDFTRDIPGQGIKTFTATVAAADRALYDALLVRAQQAIKVQQDFEAAAKSKAVSVPAVPAKITGVPAPG